MKTADLEGAALDEAVGRALGWVDYPSDSIEQGTIWHIDLDRAPFGRVMDKTNWKPSTDWEQGGPIIERELIQTNPKWHNHHCAVNPNWRERGYAADAGWHWEAHILGPENIDDPFTQDGGTLLIAAMRCFVASKLGDEINEEPK